MDYLRGRVMDYLPETPYLGVRYCPTCEPDRDPLAEILETSYCAMHAPDPKGQDDQPSGVWLSGSTESGTDGDNRRMCDLLHRDQRDDHRDEGGEG
jgi:hypothetical protein